MSGSIREGKGSRNGTGNGTGNIKGGTERKGYPNRNTRIREQVLQSREKGGYYDPLNPDYWANYVYNKIQDHSYYDNTEKIKNIFYRLFGNDWINSAFFVTWIRESYDIDKSGLTQHLFNITRPPYDIKKDMKAVNSLKFRQYEVKIEPLTKAVNQTELRQMMKTQKKLLPNNQLTERPLV